MKRDNSTPESQDTQPETEPKGLLPDAEPQDAQIDTQDFLTDTESSKKPESRKEPGFFQRLWSAIKSSPPGALIGRRPLLFAIGGGVVLTGLLILTVALLVGSDRPRPDGSNPEVSQAPTAAQPAPTSTIQPTAAIQPTPEEIKTAVFPNPLTGLELGSAELIQLRPIAVMHNNVKAAMPLLGVSHADMLYEIQVEGGLTRIMGLYQNIDDVPMLGTVRSARTVYLETALSYDAVLVHCGASSLARAEIPKWNVDTIDAMVTSSEYFWRDKDRRAAGYSSEHTLVSNGSLVRELFNEESRTTHTDEIYTQNQKFTLDTDLPQGAKAENITVRFSSAKKTSFVYNADTGLYTVYQYGKVMDDGAPGGGQVDVTNLIVLQTNVREIGNKSGHMDIDMQSGGNGYYVTGGKVIPIRWSRDGLRAPLVYTKEDGTPLLLTVGRSYVCVISDSRTPDFETAEDA